MPPKQARAPLTLTVAGGKGGVGKTSLAVNLAMVLARQGHRILLLDGDLELANVNVMLGLYPKMTLEHAIADKAGLDEVLVRVDENLDLLPGASGVQNCMDLTISRQRRFLYQLAELESRYDRVIIDTPSGLRTHALHMIAAAHLTAVIITPDPTSLTDAFSLLKLLKRRGYKHSPSVIVNKAPGLSQAKTIYQRFSTAVARYLSLDCHYLGAVWRDESIAQSVISQTPVATLPETDPSSRQFWSLADAVSLRWSQDTPRALGFSRYWIRLLERKRSSDQLEPVGLKHKTGSESEVPMEASNASPGKAEPGDASALNYSWPQHFGAWLKAAEVGSRERCQAIDEWLSLVGEALDEDTVIALQAGLSKLQWGDLPAPARQAAAAHFRHMADRIERPQPPPQTAAHTHPQSASAEVHRYAAYTYGSQETLLEQLQQQPGGRTLSETLEALRK